MMKCERMLFLQLSVLGSVPLCQCPDDPIVQRNRASFREGGGGGVSWPTL